ncbi:MAG: hypothetical protein ACYTBP_14295 [Planctomycetota bacterium]|jgi:hypothetical protein
MRWKTADEKADDLQTKGSVVELHPSSDSQKGPASGKQGDTQSGMELLDMDFLLGVIENTDSDDENDITMRKLSFDEVLRRNNQNEIASAALKVYAVNKGDLYGKTIQCEAMKELTKRTAQA